MKTPTKTAPTDPTHIRFIKRAKKYCTKNNIVLEFSPNKTVRGNNGFALGFFRHPIGGRAGRIRVATGNGINDALYILAHELEHARRWAKTPCEYAMACKYIWTRSLEECRAETEAAKLLAREGVNTNIPEMVRRSQRRKGQEWVSLCIQLAKHNPNDAERWCRAIKLYKKMSKASPREWESTFEGLFRE